MAFHTDYVACAVDTGYRLAEYVLEMVKTASENMGNTGKIIFVAPSENIPEYIKRFIKFTWGKLADIRILRLLHNCP